MRFILRGRRSIWRSYTVTFRGSAALGEILIDSRSAKCCIFPYKMLLQGGTGKVSEAAGAR